MRPWTAVSILSETTVKVDIARDILRYARRGEIRRATVRDGVRTGIEVVAADSGPGITGRYRALENALGGEDGFRGGR